MHRVELINNRVRSQNPQFRKLDYLCQDIRNNPSLDPGSFYFTFLNQFNFYAI
jgi:hypothetical protein